jgi:hypothetical protein
MNKNAVVFSSWLPPQVVYRGGLYLSYIKEFFKDCDIYIGVNHNSDLSWVDMIELNMNMENVNITLVDPELSVNSDVSGFQVALDAMRNSGKQYDTVYFMHSKGTSYPFDHQWYISCRDYFMQFAEKRVECDSELQKDDVGGWAHIARKFNMNESDYYKLMKSFIELDISNSAQDNMWLITHYAIKGEIVDWFFKNCTPEFFTTKLEDRYFFEVCFPLIIDAYGKKRVNQVFWE